MKKDELLGYDADEAVDERWSEHEFDIVGPKELNEDH